MTRSALSPALSLSCSSLSATAATTSPLPDLTACKGLAAAMTTTTTMTTTTAAGAGLATASSASTIVPTITTTSAAAAPTTPAAVTTLSAAATAHPAMPRLAVPVLPLSSAALTPSSAASSAAESSYTGSPHGLTASPSARAVQPRLSYAPHSAGQVTAVRLTSATALNRHAGTGPVLARCFSAITYKQLRFVVFDAPVARTVAHYADELVNRHVTDVFRVCEPTYDAGVLAKRGITVHDYPYKDGGLPRTDVITAFLHLVDARFGKGAHPSPASAAASLTTTATTTTAATGSPQGSNAAVAATGTVTTGATGKPAVAENAIGVHCVAGLGRAPVLVAIALIEAGLKPIDAIDLVRRCRRGAFNSVQLKFLMDQYRRQGNSDPGLLDGDAEADASAASAGVVAAKRFLGAAVKAARVRGTSPSSTSFGSVMRRSTSGSSVPVPTGASSIHSDHSGGILSSVGSAVSASHHGGIGAANAGGTHETASTGTAGGDGVTAMVRGGSASSTRSGGSSLGGRSGHHADGVAHGAAIAGTGTGAGDSHARPSRFAKILAKIRPRQRRSPSTICETSGTSASLMDPPASG